MTFIPNVVSNIDPNNSSSSNLNASSTFTGVSTITTGYNTIFISLRSDKNSTSGGLKILFSDDGTNFNTFITETYFANTIFTKSVTIFKKYYKIQYTNGSETTTSFALTSRISTDSSTDSPPLNIYTTNNDPLHDAFGKLRVSNPFTLLDLQLPGYTGPTEFRKNNMLICYENSGSFTGTLDFSFITMSGTGSGYQINQTRKYCNYQPGKSLLFLASGIIYASGPTGTATSDYKSRIGFFDEHNGLFFEYDSKDGIGVVERDNSIDNKILQTNWNVDKLDGTGISGYNLDWSKTQLFVVDFEWLGIGRIRFGFYIYGFIYYCHQITNVNILTKPYMRSPNLPIRYELKGFNASQSNIASMKQICSTVISEGGFNAVGYPFSISNGTTTISVGTSEIPLLVLLGNKTYNYYHENIIPTSYTLLDTGNSNSTIIYRLRLYLAPDSPGTLGPLNNVNINSRSAYTTTITGFTPSNSIIVDEGYFIGKTQSGIQNSLSDIFSSVTQLTSNISNISDILVLTAQTLSGTTTCVSTLTFIESY